MKFRIHTNLRFTIISVAVYACLVGSVQANFGLNPYLSGLSDSGASAAVQDDNASISFLNPAGLAQIKGNQWTAPLFTYRTSISFNNQGSKDTLDIPTTGNANKQNLLTIIPSFYYAQPLNQKMNIGFSVNSPFGLTSEYDDNWIGRYHAIKTSIETVTLTTSLGYKLSEHWSTGLGINVQKTQTELSSALDFGSICLSILDTSTCSSLGMPAPQSADGKVEHITNDWGLGFTIGGLWKKNDTRLGFAYRSKIEHNLKGKAKFSTPTSAFSPAFTNTDVEVELTLPEIFALNIQHDITNQFSLAAGTTLTRWSRIKKLTLNYANALQEDQTVPKNWKDVWRTALGIHYRIRPNWKISGGIAYENSNIPNETFEPGIPTSDATWLNAGIKYQWKNTMSLDIAWNHVFFDKRKLSQTSAFGDTLSGDIDLELDVLLIQFNWEH